MPDLHKRAKPTFGASATVRSLASPLVALPMVADGLALEFAQEMPAQTSQGSSDPARQHRLPAASISAQLSQQRCETGAAA